MGMDQELFGNYLRKDYTVRSIIRGCAGDAFVDNGTTQLTPVILRDILSTTKAIMSGEVKVNADQEAKSIEDKYGSSFKFLGLTSDPKSNAEIVSSASYLYGLVENEVNGYYCTEYDKLLEDSLNKAANTDDDGKMQRIYADERPAASDDIIYFECVEYNDDNDSTKFWCGLNVNKAIPDLQQRFKEYFHVEMSDKLARYAVIDRYNQNITPNYEIVLEFGEVNGHDQAMRAKNISQYVNRNIASLISKADLGVPDDMEPGVYWEWY
jgi:hypothetical protein